MSEVLLPDETYTIRTFKHLVFGVAEMPVPIELGDEDSVKIGLPKSEASALMQPLCVESTCTSAVETMPAGHTVSIYRPDFRPFFFDVVEPRHGIEKGLLLARSITRLSLQSEDERTWHITEGAQVLPNRKLDFIQTMKLVARYADPLLRRMRTTEI